VGFVGFVSAFFAGGRTLEAGFLVTTSFLKEGLIVSFFATAFLTGFDLAFLTNLAFGAFFALALAFAFGADFLTPLLDFFTDLAIIDSPPGHRFEKDAQKYADGPKTKNMR
jgi:hypothetical protein